MFLSGILEDANLYIYIMCLQYEAHGTIMASIKAFGAF